VAIVTERLASQIFDGAALGRSLHVSTASVRTGRPTSRSWDRGIARGTFRRGSPRYLLPSAFSLADPARHCAHAPRTFRRSGSHSWHRQYVISWPRLDPQGADLRIATLDQTIRAEHPARTHASEGGGPSGHRGATTRQHRPLRSDLL
jgi:hypothetical protein